MPVYSFRTRGSAGSYEVDDHMLPDDDTAHREAIRLTGSVLMDDPEELRSAGQWRVDVTDADRRLLFTVMTLAITPERS